MSFIDLDFTGVEANKRMSAGTHRVVISNAEIKDASTGSKMLTITCRDKNEGSTAYDNFTLVPQALWKLKIFLEAVFQVPYTAKTRLNTEALKNREVVVIVSEEDYLNNNGEPAKKAVIDEYRPVAVGDAIGIAPQAPMPQMVAPQPTMPQNPVMPQVPNIPVQPTVPVQPAPAPQNVVPQNVAPQPYPAEEFPAPQPTVPQQEQPVVAPTPTTRPKLPWER